MAGLWCSTACRSPFRSLRAFRPKVARWRAPSSASDWPRRSRLRQFKRFGICREEHLIGANGASSDMKSQRLAKFDALDPTVFEDEDAVLCGRLGQATHHLAGIYRSAGNFLPNAQFAGVLPMNRGAGISGCSIEFIDTGEIEIAGNCKVAKNGRNAAQHISETGQIACSSFGKSQSTGVPAGASSRSTRLRRRRCSWLGQDASALAAAESPLKPAPTTAISTWRGNAHLIRYEIHGPGRLSPTSRVRVCNQGSAFGSIRTFMSVRLSRDASWRSEVTAGGLTRSARSNRHDSLRFSDFEALLETLGPFNRDLSLYPIGPIRPGHPTPPALSSRPLYFADMSIKVGKQHGCSFQTFSTPANAGGKQW